MYMRRHDKGSTPSRKNVSSLISGLRKSFRRRQAARKTRSTLAVESLEQRHLLAGLVAVDFDLTTSNAPTNWTSVGTVNTPFTQSNLIDEDGNATTIDLTIVESGSGTATCGANQVCGAAATVNSATVPTHDQSLSGIEGQIFTDADPVTLTWSGLDSGADYEVYVFALEGFFGSVQQDVQITGAGAPITFTQDFNQNNLFINDELGSNTRPLSSYAEIVTADNSGEIEIQVTPNGFTLDVSLAGVALRELGAPELTLTVAADSISEGAGVAATTATVSRNTDTTNALVVNLSSGDTSEATVPASVTIPAGASISPPFAIDAVDDVIIDGTQTVAITASAAGLADGVDTVDVTDDDAAVLTVSIAAAAVSESGGVAATTATVSRNTDTTNALTVTLTSSDTGEVTVPTSVTIPAGQATSAPFDINAVDDALDDGTQVATITASAASHNDGEDTLEVVDDDVPAGLTVTVAADSVSEVDGAGATTATVARATGLTINRVDRGITTSDGSLGTQSETNSAGGLFDVTIRNESPPSPAVSHEADQESSIDAQGLDGTGLVSLADDPGFFQPIDDASFFDVYFDLSTAHTFTLTGQVFADSDSATASALVSLSGPGTSLSFSEVADSVDVGGLTTINQSGTLAPGTYRFVARADASSTGPNAAADADFEFDLQLQAAEVVASLLSDDISEATVPTSVTIAAGQASSPAFDVDAVDDAIVDGTQTVTITASATDHTDGSDTLDVTDDEVGTLSVAIVAAAVSEGDGAAATTATVSRNTAAPTALLVTLASSDTGEATVPVSVTIPAGQTTSPAFDIDAIDDAVVDGTQTVTITASAASHADGTDTLDVTDDDTAALTVAIVADSISEGDGAGATTATVTRNTDITNALTVTLSSSDTGEAAVPTTVTIPAGQTTSAAFDIDAVDDGIVDGTQTVTITASAAAHADGGDTLDVTDDDAPALTLTIVAAAVSEGAGPGATTATVTRNTDTTNPLTVTLSSNDTSEATVPASVTIAAGQVTSAAFNIDAVDDVIIDGTQAVTITASAGGHPDDTGTIDVTDDDAAGFTLVESDGFTLVFEDGTTDTVSVVLDAQPAQDVVIDIANPEPGELSVNPASLTFSSANWDTPQLVTVTGVADSVVDGDQTSTLTLSIDAAASDDAFDQVASRDVSVITKDVNASIRGTVWDDDDGSQTQNGGEPGLAGVTVYLDLNRNGQFDGGEPTELTAADGSYSFDNVAPGEYVVAQIIPAGLAQTFPPVIGTAGTFAELVNDQSSLPVFATHAPRDVGRLFIAEKNSGSIRILDLATGQLNSTPFLTIPDVDASANEAGLLGLAFHPDYANNGKFYVNVTIDNSPDTNFATHIREYTVSANPDVADPSSVREVLSFAQPFGNHNGGWIDFSPNDNFLYIASGDGGSGGDPLNSGQSLDTLLGKMLRIDVNGDDFPADAAANYAIPASNPFVGTAGAREEIWSYGLRNPWRNSFDSVTGDLWIGDVGQNAREEIDFQSAASAGGENYAWNRREGFVSFNGGASLPGDVEPVYDYSHGSGPLQGNSVIGGHVYRGQIDAFAGSYIFADSRSSNVWSFDPADPINSVQRINDLLVPDAGGIGGGPIPDDIVSFAEDGSGNLYMVQIDGQIHKVSIQLPGTQTVLVEAGEVASDVDFGNQDPQTSSISDFVWDDLDGDGIQDTGEPGVDGATVNLLNGVTLAQIDTTTTAGGGLYSFSGLAAGEYVVEFVAPGSFLFSPQDQGSNDLLDSDPDRTSGRTGVITLAASTNIDSVDAGLFQLATIGDRVWDDRDGDGIQDNGESGLNGVTVDLIGQIDDFQDGTLQGWTTAPTNPNPPQNLPNGGPDGNGDAFQQFSSNGSSGAGGRLVIRNLSQWSGDLSRTAAIGASFKNFGSTDLQMRIAVNGPGGWFVSTNAATQTITSGTDWSWLVFSLDAADLTNQFEAESAGEGGTDLAATLADVSEVRLLHNDQPNFRADPILASAGVDNITALVDSTTTSGDGNYGFSVLPGSYHVQFIAPAGRLFSPADQGTDDTLDSDADQLGNSPTITVSSGDNNETIDAGLHVPTLTLVIADDSISEGDGPAATTATVVRNTDTTGALTVSLSSSDAGEAAVPLTVTIPAGQTTSPPFDVDAIDDALVDGTQTVTITASATSHVDGVDSVDVTDDEVAALTIDISAASISEGDGAGATTATVSRNTDTSAALVVTLASSDTGEASVPATVTIPAGQSTSAPFDIDAVDDAIVDGTQTVTITASAADHADGADAIDVTDDDTAGITISPTSGLITTESGDQATFTAVLDSEPLVDVIFRLVTSDASEGTAGTGLLTFTPANWDVPQQVTVTGVDDPIIDGDIAYTIITANAVTNDPNYSGLNPPDVALTNLDNDVAGLTLTIAADSVSEADGSAATTAVVSRNTDTTNALTVTLSSSDTSEATVPATVTIPAGQSSSAPFDIAAIDDSLVDGTQTVTLTASAAGHADGTDTLDVDDDDVAVLTVVIAAASISEGAGAAATTATVSRNTDTTSALTVTLASSDTTEAAVPATVTIPAGQTTSAPFDIAAVDDAIVDGTQFVTITASAAAHTDGSDTLDVTDDDVAELTVEIDAAAVSEAAGAGATTATVSRNTDTTNALTVTLAGSDSSEATVPATVTIPAGQTTSAPFNIDAVDDAIVDGTQTVTITATAGGHADGTDTLDVTDDDVAELTVAIVAASISEAGGAGATTATVSRNTDATNALTVSLASSDTSEASVPATITIPAGQSTSAPFDIDAVDDVIADGTQTVTVTASAGGHADGSDSVDVTDDEVAALTVSIAAASISEGDGAGATTATVSRNTDPTNALVVTLVSSDTSEAAVPTTITIPAGQSTSGPIPIDAVDDAIVDGTQTVTVTASAAGHVDGDDTLDVTDDDVATLTLTILADAISEADGAGATTATVSRNTDTSAALVVTLASGDTTEATVPATVTIPAGQATSDPFNIDAVDDVILDGTQTVTVTASEATHAAASDTVDVTDNEGADLSIDSIETNATLDNKALPGDEVKVGGTFTGGGNNLRAEFDWGDGTTAPGTIDLASGTYSAVHPYATGGIFEVIVTLRDDDGGLATATIETVVSGVRLTDDGTLQIIGTSGKDKVTVKKQGARIRVDTHLHGQTHERHWFSREDVTSFLVIGCDGDDHITIDRRLSQPATISGGGGNDRIRSGRGADNIDGGEGDDHIDSDRGDDTITDEAGNNKIFSGDGNDVVRTGAGHDWIVTGKGDDIISSGGGNDLVKSGVGNDEVDGGEGNDHINSDRGNDTIIDLAGNNKIFSGRGNDVVTTGDGFDWIVTDKGHDVINSGGGRDVVKAGDGNDVVNSGGGNDAVDAGKGNDLVRGGDGHDFVFGGAGGGKDILLGEAGNDWLLGGNGRDILIGGLGRDFLFAGSGQDLLIGGTTDHDGNDAALQAILGEWTSNTSYATRVNNLRTGGGSLGGIKLEANVTVHDDGAQDRMWGNQSRDWFFADLDGADGDDDLLHDKHPNEEVDLL